MPSPVRVARPAPRRRRALHRRAPGWVGRSTVIAAGALALMGGTGAAALVDTLAGPGAGALVVAPTDAVEMQRPASGGEAASRTESATGGVPSPSPGLPLPEPAAPALPAPPPAAPAEVEPTLPDGMTPADVAAGLLTLAMPASAGGDLVVVPGSEPAPQPDGRVVSVRVEVEAGLDVEGAAFARMVMDTLNDPRSWGAEGEASFARTDGDADVRVVLAAPVKVDEMCAPLRTAGIYSCASGGAAVLNHMRWVQGTEEFADLTQYRQYLVNHEVGHLLGRRHVECPGAGQVAPVMQQQTVQVAPCLPNGWPFPDAPVG